MVSFGRFVEIGNADIAASGKLPIFPFTKNVMFASVNLAFIIKVKENETMLATTFASVMDLARKKKISCSMPLNIFLIRIYKNPSG